MFSDDMTYCSRKECKNTACFRHSCNIDWNTPKHSILGASMADFGACCAAYDPDNEVNDDYKTNGSHL